MENENTNQNISQIASQTEIQVPNSPPASLGENSVPNGERPFFLRKKILIFGGIIFLLLILLAGLLILKLRVGKGGVPQKAVSVDKTLANPDLLAIVGNIRVYKSTVEKVAMEQYVSSTITKDVLKRFYDVAIERAILDYVSHLLKISVSEEEISSYLASNHLSTGSANLVKYTLLRQKVTAIETKSVTANVINFYFSTSTSSSGLTDAQMKNDTLIALGQAQSGLEQNKTPFIIAKALYDQFNSLKVIVGINGNLYSSSATGSESYFTNPKVYTFDSKDLVPLGHTEFYSALSLMRVGEVKTVVSNVGNGGDVAKVISVSNGAYLSYKDFLDKQKKLLVKVIHIL